MHVVSKEPLSIISFGPPGKFTHMRQLDLTPHLRYAVMMGGEVEVRDFSKCVDERVLIVAGISVRSSFEQL